MGGDDDTVDSLKYNVTKCLGSLQLSVTRIKSLDKLKLLNSELERLHALVK